MIGLQAVRQIYIPVDTLLLDSPATRPLRRITAVEDSLVARPERATQFSTIQTECLLRRQPDGRYACDE